MSEPRGLRVDSGGDCEGLADAEMGGVLGVAEGVDDEGFDALDALDDGVGDFFAIAEIGGEFAAGGLEEVAVDAGAAVLEGERGDEGVAKLEGAFDQVRAGADVAHGQAGGFEGEGKDALEIGHGFGGGVDRDGGVVAKGAEVVEAHDVIGVGVGEDGGIDANDVLAERLEAELGAGIDYPGGLGGGDVDGGAGAVVARVLGSADFAIATGDRHALRSACAEEGDG